MPDRAFLLSFDDGFLNNLTVAAPIMSQLDIPGVFYVTSGFVEGNTPSWIDLIEDAVDRTGARELRLPWADAAAPIETREQKIALLDDVRAVVKGSDGLDPYEVAASIRRGARRRRVRAAP